MTRDPASAAARNRRYVGLWLAVASLGVIGSLLIVAVGPGVITLVLALLVALLRAVLRGRRRC
jgi:hypothetical protein